MTKIPLEEYKQAMWDFMIEHSDTTENGKIFVKFHTDSLRDLDRRIRARYSGYSRKDKRLNMDTLDKEILLQTNRISMERAKRAKAAKIKRKEMYKKRKK